MLDYASALDVDMTNDECVSKIKNEWDKPPKDRDQPMLRKLFRKVHAWRRDNIAKLPDCDVHSILEKHPMLGDINFVSNSVISVTVFVLQFVNKSHLLTYGLQHCSH